MTTPMTMVLVADYVYGVLKYEGVSGLVVEGPMITMYTPGGGTLAILHVAPGASLVRIEGSEKRYEDTEYFKG